MSSNESLGLLASRDTGSLQPGVAEPADLRDLISLSLQGLTEMVDPRTQLFCDRVVRSGNGLVREGISQRYTMMTLLGLKELELAGVESPFDLQTGYDSLLSETNWIKGAGDLGLLIWTTAALQPDRLERVLRTFACETALRRYEDARQQFTMELSWFLSGLAHAAETSSKLASQLMDLCVETFRLIGKNQGDRGFFGHLDVEQSLTGRLRGRIGSFADQVYPIYAFSKFARAFHIEDPLGPALKCATAICDAQGELGQWWWLYDSRIGRVSSRYPVYAVHQHAMAPMALFAVEEATGKSFQKFIYKGLRWIYGANELGVDMRDQAHKLIWRCQLPRRQQSKYFEMALSMVRPPVEKVEANSLKVLHEQRPYEYGWLIYAFAKHSQPTLAVRS